MTNPPAPSKPPRRSPRPTLLALAAVAAVAALAVPAFLGAAFSPGHAPATQRSQHGLSLLADQPDAIASEAVAQMQAIAQGSAQEMQQAGAAAVAEYQDAGSGAAQALGESQAQGAQQVNAVAAPPSTLQQPPADGNVTDVKPSPQSSSVPGYTTPSFSSDSGTLDLGVATFTVTPYDGSDAHVKARVALNLPQTGIAGLDGAAMDIVDLYVTVKDGSQKTDESAANQTDGSTGGVLGAQNNVTFFNGQVGTVTSTGEETSYAAAPDEKGAQSAYDHATAVIGKANATLMSLLSGVKASIAVEANLTATVQAEIDQTMEAEAAAEAAVDAEADARVNATFAAEAEAEAQAHAAAERHVEVIKQAHLAASQKVHAEATQQVELVTSAAAQAQQSLREQAAAALQAGTQAAAAIQAAAQAAAQAIAHAPGLNNTEASAKVAAIMGAAAAAEASAQAKANATAKALLAQASAVGAQVDVKVKAILALETSAEASLDAKAEVAAKATARAEVYTVAKIHANAQAQAQAHLRAAAAAKAKMEASAKAHVRVVIKAALRVAAAANASFNGAAPLGDEVSLHTEQQVDPDVQYMKDVAADYSKEPPGADMKGRADHWYGTANDVDFEKSAVLGIVGEIDPKVNEGIGLAIITQQELMALGQKYL